MKSVRRAGHAVALLAALSACSGGVSSSGAPTFPSTPYTTATSSSGALAVAVRTSPQPPSRGTNDVQLTVTRTADGSSVDGLSLDVVPLMPSMGHGTATPTVTPQGGGVYLVTGVYLYMPGTWELQTSFSGPLQDDATPILTVD